MLGINLLAVSVAGIVGTCLNILWYSKFLFGRKQTASLKTNHIGINREEKGRYKILPAVLVAELIIAYVIAYLIALTGSYSFLTLLELISWIWLGFAVALLSNCVFRGGLAWLAYLTNVGYRLVSWMTIGLVIIYLSKLT
jgi:hypothetical protein